jgi:AraC-like DNA-binding protein
MLQTIYELDRDSDRYPVYWECGNPRCLRHFHNSLEFAYCIEGQTEAVMGGRTISLGEGELLLVSSCTLHAYLGNRDSRILLMIVPLGFIPLYTPLFARKVFSQVKTADPELVGEVLHCLKRLLALGPCCEQNENLVRSYIYVVLGLLTQQVGLTDAPEGQTLSQEVLLFLQNSYRYPLSLEDVSRHFGYSKYRFSHIFNVSIGCSLTHYLDSLRAKHAANLLRESDAPLLDVAMSSGFDSMRTFYRSFKVCFGMTPSQYRRSVGVTLSHPSGQK